jgi:type IV pilus assembly protein PilM
MNPLEILKDPPPEFAFEIAADGIAMSRTRPPSALQRVPLAPGILIPSPVKDNVTDADELARVVRTLVPAGSGRGRRTAALILPDNSLRLAVLDFETLPPKDEDRLSLIKFRLKKTLPFDVDEAALSWFVQTGNKALAAVAPVEVIARYEAPFRAAGLHPGLVTCSSLALLELLPRDGSQLVAHLSPGALTVLALRDGVVTLARTLELAANTTDYLDEVSADLYPTLIYLEDQAGHQRPDKLILAGFGAIAGAAATRLAIELDIPVEVLDADNPGLTGYLKSLQPAQHRKKAA